jgi:amidase
VLGPVCTDPPPPPDHDIASLEAHAANGHALRLCAVTSLVGLPSVSVPVLLQDGLPQAVQVIASFYREDLCFAAASATEAHVRFDRSHVTQTVTADP